MLSLLLPPEGNELPERGGDELQTLRRPAAKMGAKASSITERGWSGSNGWKSASEGAEKK